jgi:hypothetical protein
MVNPIDCFAEKLAGADYDGDYVKIIDDEKFVKAAKNDLPLIEIPVVKSLEDKFPKFNNDEERNKREDEWTAVEWNTVENTFSNSVGVYTNYAFNIAAEAYNESSGNEETKKIAEEQLNLMTILIGLEIDSAKTGKKPYIPDEFKKGKEYFLYKKNQIKKNGYYRKDTKEQFDEVCNLNNLQNIIDTKQNKVMKQTSLEIGKTINTINLIELLSNTKLEGSNLTTKQKNMMTALFIAHFEITNKYYDESEYLSDKEFKWITEILNLQGKLSNPNDNS